MNRTLLFSVAASLMLSPVQSSSKTDDFRISAAADIADLAFLGTLNAEVSCTVHRHLSVRSSIRFNPWKFRTGDRMTSWRVLEGYAGLRYWPWFADCGWFADAGVTASVFSRYGSGYVSFIQGERYGTELTGGYAFMLSEKLNMEISSGVRLGYSSWEKYSHPSCGVPEGKGKGLFAEPVILQLRIRYLF